MAFQDLQRLKVLDLSHNEIISLHETIFINLNQLVALDLSMNQLESLEIQDLGSRDDSRRTVKKLIKLNLEDNPWKCDCELGRFYTDLQYRKISPKEARCNNGLMWSKITSKNFTCSPNLLTKTPPQRNLQIGDNLTLHCSFEANPRPIVLWKYQGVKIVDHGNGDQVVIESVNEAHTITFSRMILQIHVSQSSVGEYTCHAFNEVDKNFGVIPVSLANALIVSTNKTMETSVGVSVSLLVLLSVLGSLFCYWRHKKKVSESGNVSSFSILNNTNSLPPMKKEDLDIPFSNPVPKPPRIGLYNSNNNVLHGVDLDSSTLRSNNAAVPYNHERFLSHYISNQHLYNFPQYPSQPPRVPDNLESLPWLHQRPGSRASIGTVSTMMSSYYSDYPPSSTEHKPPSLVRNQTHPPQQQQTRPGYVTLPRKPKTRPPSPFIPLDNLGPRTSADGSSFHNIASMMTSPTNDKLSLPNMPPQVVGNNNKEEPIEEDCSNDDDPGEVARNEDSPPNTSRQILDTIPEQD